MLALAATLLCALSGLPLDEARAFDATLPVLLPDEALPPFPEGADPRLQEELEARVRRVPQWSRLAREGRLAVGLLDLRRLESPRLAAIDPDRMLYAASLPKIAILLAAHQAIADGELAEGAEVQQDLHDMIRVSSNPAATRMIDRLGYARIGGTMTDPRYRLFDPALGGGLWVGKRYAKEGDRRGDPLRGITHAATVRQVLRFYWLLFTGRLVSPERSRLMLDALMEPALPYKFACVLSEAAPGACLYRKSGSWRTFHSDSVLVWEPGERRYVLVALLEDPAGERLLQALVPAAEGALLATAPPAAAAPVPAPEPYEALLAR